MNQQDLFADTITATNEAIDRAGRNAPEDWKRLAHEAVAYCAKLHDSFTADEVWERLEEMNVPPPATRAALGPILKRAAEIGIVYTKGEWQRRSRFKRRHRQLLIWRSKKMSRLAVQAAGTGLSEQPTQSLGSVICKK